MKAACGSPPNSGRGFHGERHGQLSRASSPRGLRRSGSEKQIDLFNLEQGAGIISPPVPPPSARGAASFTPRRISREGRVAGRAGTALEAGDTSESETEGAAQKGMPACCGRCGISLPIVLLVVLLNLLAVGCFVYGFVAPAQSSGKLHDLPPTIEVHANSHMQVDETSEAQALAADMVNTSYAEHDKRSAYQKSGLDD